MPQTCPYCRETIPEAELAECPACHTPHHPDCWEENGGCTVFGCEHAPTDDPKIAVSSHEIGGGAESPAAARTYYLGRNGEQSGPHTLEALRQEVYRGAASRNDLVWAEGMVNWVPLSQVLEPPQIPAQSYTQAAYRAAPTPRDVDPCEGRMEFGRGLYFLTLVAGIILAGILNSSPETELIGVLVFWCIHFPAAVLRARDVGMSGWVVLFLFVPIANLFIGFRLLLAPRGYAITKQADSVLRVMTWIFVGLLVLVVIGLIIAAISES